MHKVKKQVGWQVSRPLTQRLELCIGHPLDVRKAKAPSASPHASFRENSVFSLTSSRFPGGERLCHGLPALSWDSYDSPGE